MAAEELKKEWGIKICACEKELEVLRDSKKNLMMDYYRKDYTLEPDLTVCDGETFEAAGVTWKVIETPGHTIGSCCYYIESEDLLFAGDTLFRTSYGRVDLPHRRRHVHAGLGEEAFNASGDGEGISGPYGRYLH